MHHFFIAILIVLSAGLFSLLSGRQARSVNRSIQMISVGLMAGGCLWGLVDALAILRHSTGGSLTLNYLHMFALSFKTDGVSAFFLAVIWAVCGLACVYSYNYMDHEAKPVKTRIQYFFFSVLIASMVLVVTAANSLTFLLAWEIMSLSSFFLVMHHHEEEENRKAGYLYFVFSHVGAMFILASFGLMYAWTGSPAFESLAGLPESVRILIFMSALVGFGSKAGVFPFHVWLPFAHPAAPSHISAVMSGVMIKTGIYGIIRVYMLLDLHTGVPGMVMILAGSMSGVLGVVYALGQHDLKKLLAYHSVENIGIILMGLGVGMIGVSSGHPVMAVLGFTGGLLHVLNHALFKSLLFMGAGMVLHRTGTRSIDALGGLMKTMKLTGITFLIGSLAISGLPPFNGFVGEFMIYVGGFHGVALDPVAFIAGIVAVISLAVIGGLALACFTKVLGVVFQGEPRTGAGVGVTEKGPTMMAAMVVLAGACVLIGVFPQLILDLPMKAVQDIGPGLGAEAFESVSSHAGSLTLGALTLVGLFVVVLAIRAFCYKGKALGASGTWGCGFTRPTARMQYTGSSYASSILDFFRPAAPLTEHHPPVQGRFPAAVHYESHIRDIAGIFMYKTVVNPIMYFFDRLRWIQHGDIHLYIGYILLAIVLLLFFI